MNLKDDAVWLIIDPWVRQPKPHNTQYVNNINDYFCHKIHEYMKSVKNKFVVMHNNERESYGVSELLKDYPRLTHEEVPNRLKTVTSVVYVGFHHGRCTINRDYSGAKFMRHHNDKLNIYFKKDLLCLLPGDSWLEMDKKSEQYGELI